MLVPYTFNKCIPLDSLPKRSCLYHRDIPSTKLELPSNSWPRATCPWFTYQVRTGRVEVLLDHIQNGVSKFTATREPLIQKIIIENGTSIKKCNCKPLSLQLASCFSTSNVTLFPYTNGKRKTCSAFIHLQRWKTATLLSDLTIFMRESCRY